MVKLSKVSQVNRSSFHQKSIDPPENKLELLMKGSKALVVTGSVAILPLAENLSKLC
jgi:hypothetical protein